MRMARYVFLFLLLAGCSSSNKCCCTYIPPCIRSHSQVIVTTSCSGETCSPIISTITVCDERKIVPEDPRECNQ